ncbi:MAG TPA: winged helix-turn-helix domain-containing protein [Nitrososphaeraceae archaeon]|nr:winged helix-turn-helix domain-containing protein [Nitrososphaeraceae archaeon]
MAGESFDRYKTILDKARNEKLEVLNTWYSLFKLKEDPFAKEIADEEIESYFIDRENIIENIIFDIGVASREIPIIVLIVAPTGFGKSSLLKYIYHIITKIASSNKEKYNFKGEYMPVQTLFETEDDRRGGEGDTNDDDDNNNKDNVQSWIKISKRIRDFILFDDANPNYIRTIIKEFTNTKLKLFAISPIDLEQALSIIQYEPKIYFLSDFNYNDSVRMLEQRLKITIQTENKNNIKIYDLFDETAIKTIYDNSFGIPKLILECSSKALSLLKSIVIGKPSKSEQQQIDNNNNNKRVTSQIAIQACRQIKCQQAKKEYENLSDVRKEIIDKIIFKARSASDIAAEIRKDRTTVSRYLNELKDIDLITFNTQGRETLYKATLPTQILFEMEHMPTIEKDRRRSEEAEKGEEKRHV